MALDRQHQPDGPHRAATGARRSHPLRKPAYPTLLPELRDEESNYVDEDRSSSGSSAACISVTGRPADQAIQPPVCTNGRASRRSSPAQLTKIPPASTSSSDAAA